MRACDVMSSPVITVRPATPVAEVARAMVEHRISGIPVTDASGKLVGIVTDGDLYRRIELGTEKRHDEWLRMLTSNRVAAAEYVEAHARLTRDVMTTAVVAVTPEATLGQIADLFETRRIRRVPVLADGRVVGIVSRANLVQALASAPPEQSRDHIEDQHIRDLVLAAFRRMPWGLRSEGNVIVRHGVLHLWGFVASDAELAALRIAAEAVPGVQQVVDHTVRFLGDVGASLRQKPRVTIIGPDDCR
jgi:CBS domain-containing protein